MRRLGEVLTDERMATEQQIGLALKEQRSTGELLGNVLLRLGIVNRKELSRAVAISNDLPFVDLKTTFVEPAAVQLVDKMFAERYRLMPFAIDGENLKVAMDNPSDVVAIDALRRAVRRTVLVYAADLESVMETIEFQYGLGASIDEEVNLNLAAALSGGQIAEGEVEAPVIRLLELIFIKAIRDRATDIHFSPEEMITRISFRVDGIMRGEYVMSRQIHVPLITRIKVLSGMNIAENRLPQDGSIQFKFSGRSVDIRSSLIPTHHGENAVLRILDKSSVAQGLESLGMSQELRSKIERLIRIPFGIVLAAGPTGSGKTTTLYAMLRLVNAMEKNVLTIEDPIEYQMPLIKQAQVNKKIDFGFAQAIRTFLRQDPDIILVGEIRDLETTEMALQAAMTGHLVLSTIHTNDAPSTVARLLDLGVEPYLLPSSLKAVVAQRLIRRICTNCREEYRLSAEEIADYGLAGWPDAGGPLFRGRGCELCNESGYHGRLGIYEIMTIGPSLSELVSTKASIETIKQQAIKDGMVTMFEYGLDQVKLGLTTIDEILRVTQ
ncbi:MAG: type II/IV secretion system protein [Deltaproteobacteria bacterium]|nr:type II/IV secretion system protein [Deltaproteobacteria bacterium]